MTTTPVESTETASLIHAVTTAVARLHTTANELKFQAWKTGRAGLNERPAEDTAAHEFEAAVEALRTIALGGAA